MSKHRQTVYVIIRVDNMGMSRVPHTCGVYGNFDDAEDARGAFEQAVLDVGGLPEDYSFEVQGATFYE